MLLFFIALTPRVLIGAAAEDTCVALLDNRRITLIVPFSAGGGYDTYARIFAPVLEQRTGARVIVRNITGAGGVLGIRAVTTARIDNPVLGILNPVTLVEAELLGREAPGTDSLVMLGSLIEDPTVWVVQAGSTGLLNASGVRVFGLSSNSEFTRVMLPAAALGLDAQTVGGYSGTADSWLALLRGEIDIFYGPTESVQGYLENTDMATPLLSLTKAANPVFPDAPYLAGSGGVVDIQTRSDDPVTRDLRMQLASLAVDLSSAFRAVTISSNQEPAMIQCLQNAVEEVLFSPELKNLADARGLELQPGSSADMQAIMDRIDLQLDNNADVIDGLIRAPGN